MPVSPTSRFAHLPLLRTVGPGGDPREAIALRLSPPTLSTGGMHRVLQGETVDLLAHRYYGDASLWWRILDGNELVYPLDIQPGDQLHIPAPGPVTRVTRARSF